MKPILSNDDIGSNMNVYEESLEKNTSHDVATRLNMTTAYGAGVRNTRDFYEAARKQDAERIADLEAVRPLVANTHPIDQALTTLRSLTEQGEGMYSVEFNGSEKERDQKWRWNGPTGYGDWTSEIRASHECAELNAAYQAGRLSAELQRGEPVACLGQDHCAREKARRFGIPLPVECTCAAPKS